MMNAAQLFFLFVTFAAVSGVAYLVIAYFGSSPESQRLQAVADDAQHAVAPPHDTSGGWFNNLLAPLAKLSLPAEKWENSPLRVRFMNAGFRGVAAPVVYFSTKTLLTFVLPGLFALYVASTGTHLTAQAMLLGMLTLAATGYYLPNIGLAHMISRRQRELFENFPDALDLMRICVEAGLGLDAAIARVGEELRLNSEALYDELHLVSLELRAGAARERALRNLALRMGLDDVDALVAMLVQADRFGTSIADSLRVHSDNLRLKRRLRAEETAAKVPVKLLFPLIFCLFPAFLVVLLGPAFISIYRVLFAAMAGN